MIWNDFFFDILLYQITYLKRPLINLFGSEKLGFLLDVTQYIPLYDISSNYAPRLQKSVIATGA